MARPQDRWLGRVILLCCLVAAGCVAVKECGGFVEGGMAGVECDWCSGSAC